MYSTVVSLIPIKLFSEANPKGATTPPTATRLLPRQESEPTCTYIWNDISEQCKLEQDSFHSIGRFVCSTLSSSVHASNQ